MSTKKLLKSIILLIILIKISKQSPINSRINSKLIKRQLNTSYGKADRSRPESPYITGIRAEGDSRDVSIGESGNSIVRADKQITIRLFGINLNQSDIEIGFATKPGNKNGGCLPTIYDIQLNSDNQYTTLVSVNLPSNDKYYLCMTYPGAGQEEGSSLGNRREQAKHYFYVSERDDEWMIITAEGMFMPLGVQISLIVILLIMSGLFSGLNLGLMALDKNELQVIERCGTEQEKHYARAITPVRKRGNYLLCTLLLGNVLVNSTLTILLDELTSGIVAVVASTLSIVVFGEIIPQALCSRHGLAVGARTVWLTYIFMVVTFPLSFPISKVLDKVLGEEIGNVYDRERLMEYIRVTKDYNRLEADEVNIISGALKLKKIKVVEIMTPISDVYMLPYNSILNFETMNEINKTGYSRIPIYENERNNVVAILHVKDLAFIDPDSNMPLKALIEFHKHPLYFVYEDVTLDVMLNEFKQGKSHMAFVRRINDDGINDPVYELAGVVTLEDVIEELIQAEINDETDVISDNRRKQKRKEVMTRPNYSDFVRLGGEQESAKIISSQLALAAFRYLSTFVEPFTGQYLSENVLKRLMSKRIYYEVKIESSQFDSELTNIPVEGKLYTYGKPADYFVLILEGKVKVIIGKENQHYEGGPFAFFGTSVLKLSPNDNEQVSKSTSLGRLSISDAVQQSQETGLKSSSSAASTTERLRTSLATTDNSFIPDFTVFCIENTTYMKVTRNMYSAAIRATKMERQRDSQQSVDPEDDGIHFELDPSSENRALMSASSSTNLVPERGRSRSDLLPTSSTSKIQSTSSQKQSSGSSSRASASTPEAPLPKYEELSNSISSNRTNLVNDNNTKNESNDSIDKRNTSPADEKSHLI